MQLFGFIAVQSKTQDKLTHPKTLCREREREREDGILQKNGKWGQSFHKFELLQSLAKEKDKIYGHIF